MKITKCLGLLLLLFLAVNCKKNDDDTAPVVLDSEKRITSFLFDASSNNALANDVVGVINESAKTISATVPFGVDLSALTPTIQISEKASINVSGTRDFSDEVSYVVTAEDNSSTNYTVVVSNELNTEKAITSFQLRGGNNGLSEDVESILDEEAKTITIYVPNNATVANLLPTVETSAAATYAPTGFQDFTNNVSYTVTAEDGSTATYEVMVIRVAITSFRLVRFSEIAGDILLGEGTIDDASSEIEVIVSEFQDPNNLPTPRIEFADEITITPTGVQNFTNPVNYTLNAPNGVSVTYEITVRRAFKSITSFRFNRSQNAALTADFEGTINEAEKIISVVLPQGTNPSVRESLIPTIAVTAGSGATVSPTGAQDFSNAVSYTVTGLDGSTNTYSVTVIISPL